MKEIIIDLEKLNNDEYSYLFGINDQNIKLLNNLYQTNIVYGENKIVANIKDEEVDDFKRVLGLMIDEVLHNQVLDEQKIMNFYDDNESYVFDLKKDIIVRTQSGRGIYPKTRGQKYFCDAIENSNITFALGPAGTGKTFLAICEAVNALKKGNCKKIVLTRPAVEAGENLGFLPGDLKEKIDPYLIPLYDGLYDTLGHENTEKLIEKGVIEIAPLAYMRGRTLNESFIILDEAQNTTDGQMQMFLTRLGFNSKMVITGDPTQVDLKIGKNNGLVSASEILDHIDSISIVYLNSKDVVRNPLVQKIIEAYAKKLK